MVLVLKELKDLWELGTCKRRCELKFSNKLKFTECSFLLQQMFIRTKIQSWLSAEGCSVLIHRASLITSDPLYGRQIQC